MIIIIKSIAYAVGALIALPFAIMAGAGSDWIMTVQRICDNLLEEIDEKEKEDK